MRLARPRIRHPLYPALSPIPAAEATGLCQALTGTFPELAEAGAAGARASQVVFPMVDTSNPFLGGPERDLLWELFQVPAYVLMLDTKGEVIGYECEAHCGLHLAGPLEDRSVTGRIDSSPCDCGRPGSRLLLNAAGAV